MSGQIYIFKNNKINNKHHIITDIGTNYMPQTNLQFFITPNNMCIYIYIYTHIQITNINVKN